MKRHEWLFAAKVSDIVGGARKKRAHHDARRKFWAKKKEEVIKKIRASGLEVDLGLAAQMYASGNSFGTMSLGKQVPQVRVRTDLSSHLGEAHAKVEEHRIKVVEYDRWIDFLKDQPPGAIREFDHEDHAFFFGA